MSDRKGFLLRLDPHLMALLKQWAEDDFRSLNGQIEFLLRQALKDRGRWKPPPPRSALAAEVADSGQPDGPTETPAEGASNLANPAATPENQGDATNPGSNPSSPPAPAADEGPEPKPEA